MNFMQKQVSSRSSFMGIYSSRKTLSFHRQDFLIINWTGPVLDRNLTIFLKLVIKQKTLVLSKLSALVCVCNSLEVLEGLVIQSIFQMFSFFRASAQASPAPAMRSGHTFSRTEEKKTLGHLNDRFASYISRVRDLEMRNSSLQKRHAKEILTMRRLYEGELSQVCRIIPSFAHLRAFQLEFISGKKSSRRTSKV